MKQKLTTFRQGDVLLIKLEHANLQPLGEAERRGECILAYGESSGHRHTLRPKRREEAMEVYPCTPNTGKVEHARRLVAGLTDIAEPVAVIRTSEASLRHEGASGAETGEHGAHDLGEGTYLALRQINPRRRTVVAD